MEVPRTPLHRAVRAQMSLLRHHRARLYRQLPRSATAWGKGFVTCFHVSYAGFSSCGE